MKPKRDLATTRLDRLALLALVVAGVAMAGHAWLREHPQHDPFAPLALADPPGWATPRKIAALRDDISGCRAVLQQGGVEFTVFEPSGTDQCRRLDRTQPQAGILSPAAPQMTCPVLVGYEIWLRHAVQPAAEEMLGQAVSRIEHLGTYNCRRIGGGDQGNWSEHATGNAIDIAAFVLADGRRIGVLEDWDDEGSAGRFLHRVRDRACASHATVLSPDYNAAHADHLHLDQASRMVGSFCR